MNTSSKLNKKMNDYNFKMNKSYYNFNLINCIIKQWKNITRKLTTIINPIKRFIETINWLIRINLDVKSLTKITTRWNRTIKGRHRRINSIKIFFE